VSSIPLAAVGAYNELPYDIVFNILYVYVDNCKLCASGIYLFIYFIECYPRVIVGWFLKIKTVVLYACLLTLTQDKKPTDPSSSTPQRGDEGAAAAEEGSSDEDISKLLTLKRVTLDMMSSVVRPVTSEGTQENPAADPSAGGGELGRSHREKKPLETRTPLEQTLEYIHATLQRFFISLFLSLFLYTS